jgi:tungstate transport system permease protein
VLGITLFSLQVSGAATGLSLVVGIPLGILLAMKRFPGRSLAVSLINTGMGLPPVVVGLFVTIFLWRSGPLGYMELLYTPTAMIIAQVVIAFPIVAGLTMAAFQSLNPNLRLQLLGIGASTPQLLWLLCKEARLPLLAAIMAGFRRSHLRSRRIDDGRRQHSRPDPRTDDCDRFGNEQRQL